MPGSVLIFGPERRASYWTNFVSAVASCASTAHSANTFDCLKNANYSDIFTGLVAATHESPEMYAFYPTFDGPDGLYPDLPSRMLAEGHFSGLPFIGGTNLDEGKFYPSRMCSSICWKEFRHHSCTLYRLFGKRAQKHPHRELYPTCWLTGGTCWRGGQTSPVLS
jgi:carboxylesterase type B